MTDNMTDALRDRTEPPLHLSRRFATAEEIMGAEKLASFLTEVTAAFEDEVEAFTADLTGHYGLDDTQAVIVMHETIRKVFHLDEGG